MGQRLAGPPRPAAAVIPRAVCRTPVDRSAKYYPASAEGQHSLPLRHRNPLTDAASSGDFECLMSLLQMRGFDVNVLSEAGETALHVATRRQDIHMMEALLARGAAVNALDRHGYAPLHHVVCNAEPAVAVTALLTGRPVGTPADIIALLLSYGADVNAVSFDGVSVIHEALRNKKIAEATVLLSKGVHFETVSALGDTPLHEACRTGDALLADAILKSKLYCLLIPQHYMAMWASAYDLSRLALNVITLPNRKKRIDVKNWVTNPVPVMHFVTALHRPAAATAARSAGAGGAGGVLPPPQTACSATAFCILFHEFLQTHVMFPEIWSFRVRLDRLDPHRRTAAAAAGGAVSSPPLPLPTPAVAPHAPARLGAKQAIPPNPMVVVYPANRWPAFIRAPANDTQLLPFVVAPMKVPPGQPWPKAAARLSRVTQLFVDVFNLHLPSADDAAACDDADEDGESEGDDDGSAPAASFGSNAAGGEQLLAPRHVVPAFGQCYSQNRHFTANPLDAVGKDGKTPLGCCNGWGDDKKLIMSLLSSRATFLLDDEVLL